MGWSRWEQRELDRDIDDENDKEKKGFTEDKQEDIFNKAHQLASAKGSKRGLGDKAKLGKEFAGTKKSFDGRQEEEEERKERKERKERRKRRRRGNPKTKMTRKRNRPRSPRNRNRNFVPP